MSLLATVNARGTLAARPAAAAANEGYIYWATDSTPPTWYRSNGTSWDAQATSGMTNPMTTAGDLIYGGASGSPTRLGIGTAGQVLTVSGGNPGWAAAGGGGGALAFLAAVTASNSATMDFASFISSTYDTYIFKFVSILPATSTAILWMRMGTGAGPTYDAGANYGDQIWRHVYNAGAGISAADSGSTRIALTGPWLSTGVHGISGSLELYDPQSATLNKYVSGKFVYPDSGPSLMAVSEMGGQYNSITAVTAVRFLMSAGNITSGTIRVYGVAKS